MNVNDKRTARIDPITLAVLAPMSVRDRIGRYLELETLQKKGYTHVTSDGIKALSIESAQKQFVARWEKHGARLNWPPLNQALTKHRSDQGVGQKAYELNPSKYTGAKMQYSYTMHRLVKAKPPSEAIRGPLSVTWWEED